MVLHSRLTLSADIRPRLLPVGLICDPVQTILDFSRCPVPRAVVGLRRILFLETRSIRATVCVFSPLHY